MTIEAAPKKKKPILQWVLIGLAVVVAFNVINPPDKDRNAATTQEAEKPREVVYNSPLDGSVRQVEKYLDGTLNDKDSYESVEWGQVVKTDAGFAVRHKFRATNRFGAKVLQTYVFTLDATGSVTGASEVTD